MSGRVVVKSLVVGFFGAPLIGIALWTLLLLLIDLSVGVLGTWWTRPEEPILMVAMTAGYAILLAGPYSALVALLAGWRATVWARTGKGQRVMRLGMLWFGTMLGVPFPLWMMIWHRSLADQWQLWLLSGLAAGLLSGMLLYRLLRDDLYQGH